jgi:hypothetical protein
MKKIVYFSLVFNTLFALISCGEDTPTPSTPDFNYNLSTNSIDFGYKTNSVSIQLNVENGKKLNWRAYNNNPNKWFEFDYLEGDSSKTMNISIQRSKLNFGKNIDTLFFVASIPLSVSERKNNGIQSKDSIRTLVLTAFRNPTSLEAFSFQIKNQLLILKPYYDSTYSFIGSYNVDFVGTKTSFGIANFCSSNKIFSDAGTTFSFQSFNNSSTLSPTSIEKKSFTFYIDSINSINANYYCSIIPNDKILFNNSTIHKFNISGGSEFNTPFTDEITSVTPIECFPEPNPLTVSTIPMSIFWNKTDTPDDSVYAVIIAKSDNNFKAFPVKAVNDDIGALKILPASLQKVKTGNSQVYVWIIRYRNKIDITNKRILVSQSQKSYEIILN